jgi:formylglycine-generating enzyme required for sulfatase activity
MHRLIPSLLVLSTLCLTAFQPVSAITIDTVPVGNPGNVADFRYPTSDYSGGYGAVAQTFRIGTTEVTNAQYVAMLNAVAAVSDPYNLYLGRSGPPFAGLVGIVVRSDLSGRFTYAVAPPALNGTYTYDNKPVVVVDSGMAMRFANWLSNGQPTGREGPGTTETGAYTLNGATTDAALALVTRNVGARWWLPSLDEWYKAAYYNPATGSYFDFPTRTSIPPNNNPPSQDTGNSANFHDTRGYTTGDSDYPLTDVGSYTLSIGPYGTFDQGGNVEEWNDTLVGNGDRAIQGGSWNSNFSGTMAGGTPYRHPTYRYVDLGFRVATVPEPSTAALAVVALGVMCVWRLAISP